MDSPWSQHFFYIGHFSKLLLKSASKLSHQITLDVFQIRHHRYIEEGSVFSQPLLARNQWMLPDAADLEIGLLVL